MKKSVFVLSILGLLLTACAPAPALTTPTSVPVAATIASTSVPTAIPTAVPTAMPTTVPTPSGPRTLAILTHEAFAISDDVLKKFESDNNVTIKFIKEADAGPALNRAILTKDNPEAAVIFGVDNTLMGRALDAGILDPYQPAALSQISTTYQLDPSGQLTPIDYGDVCLNYDKNYFTQKKLALPQTLIDL